MMFAQYCRIESRAGGCNASNREMIRAALSMIQKKHRFARASRSSRHAWLREMLSIHRDAQLEYMAVMSGRSLK